MFGAGPSMPFVLNESWVGRRVSVRRVVLDGADGQIRFADVVGDLLELTARTALIESAAGPVRLELDRIALARQAFPSTADVLALAAIYERGWRAAETERLGGWLLRADNGGSGRANSALPLGRPETSLDDTLTLARQWYARRGLPLTLQCPLPARSLLDAELGERGWPARTDVHVLAGRLDVLTAPAAPPTGAATGADTSGGCDPDSGIGPVRVESSPDDGWLACYDSRRGSPSESAHDLLTRHPRVGFLSVRDGETVLGIARAVVDEGWLGVNAVGVNPAHRRLGIGTALVRAAWSWAREHHGATRSYLQVEATNQPAITAYLGLGYWHHHDYRYRTEPEPEELPSAHDTRDAERQASRDLGGRPAQGPGATALGRPPAAGR